MFLPLDCIHANRCSGCAWIHLPYDEQRLQKLAHLSASWQGLGLPPLPEPEWVSLDSGALRDRTDLMIYAKDGPPRLGLFAKDSREIVDLPTCAQLSPRLQAALTQFRLHVPSVVKGSVRLRVSPQGQVGIWLDFANLDVKTLLDEKTELRALMEWATVEIGQRRKRLVEREGLLKLADPELGPWFETYADDQVIPLYSTIGSFTQPGFRANHALVATLLKYVKAAQPKRLLEFGAGSGNFTLPLASQGMHITACEMDELACQGLARAVSENGWDTRVDIQRGNFQINPDRWNLPSSEVDGVLVDPPRSGLMQFLDPLLEGKPPRWFFYVSCFAESFAKDSQRLIQAGYRLRQLAIVDQFPQSPHYEIVTAFEYHP